MDREVQGLKFIADGMLGRFSRWLRILGYDVKYYNNASDSALLRVSEKENRTLLTRDKGLFSRARSIGLKTLFMKGENEVERLAYIAKSLNIKLEINGPTSRCPICGSSLHRVERDAVLSKVSDGTFNHHNDFWVCNECGKVYWVGSHWKNINETLNKARILQKHYLSYGAKSNCHSK